MPLLTETELDSCFDIELNVTYKKIESINSVVISEEDDCFRIRISIYAVYTVYKTQDRIECEVFGFEEFFSTLFNIPFSVYCIIRGECVLHSCSVICNEQLICFAGEKGVGKSTLMKLLDGEKMTAFSDDTIKVSVDKMAYKAHSLMKLTENTVSALNVCKLLGVKNAAGKQYVRITSENTEKKIGAVILLKRGKYSKKIIPVVNSSLKTGIFCENIVGINYFCTSLLSRSLEISKNIELKINFGILSLPDDISKLCNIKNEIANVVELFAGMS